MRVAPIPVAAFAVVAALWCGTVPVRTLQTGASRTALAIVSDQKNKPIVDIGVDDFIIQEGGQAREVLSVHIADYPIVVLLDNGGDARVDMAPMRKAVERFVDRLGIRPIAIGTVGDPPAMLTTFEDERPKMMEALAALEVNPVARSLLLQSAAMGAEAIHRTGTLFSGLVALSATPADSSRNNVDAMIGSIVDSGTMLHVIANRSTQPVSQMGQIRSGQALRSIAEQTRGDYTVIYSPASYQPALDKLSERLSSEIMIEYLVPPGSKPVDVRVGVRLPGLKVRGLGVAPR